MALDVRKLLQSYVTPGTKYEDGSSQPDLQVQQAHPGIPLYVRKPSQVANPRAKGIPNSRTLAPQLPQVGGLIQPSPSYGADMQQRDYFDQQQPQVGVTAHSLDYLANGGDQTPFDIEMQQMTPAQTRHSLGLDKPVSFKSTLPRITRRR